MGRVFLCKQVNEDCIVAFDTRCTGLYRDTTQNAPRVNSPLSILTHTNSPPSAVAFLGVFSPLPVNEIRPVERARRDNAV